MINITRKIRFSGEQFEHVAEIILRVPGLFIFDYWWQFDLHQSIPKSFEWPDIVSAGLTNLVVLQGLILFLLPLEQLVALYMHYISVALVASADVFSRQYVLEEQKLSQSVPTSSVNVLDGPASFPSASFFLPFGPLDCEQEFLKRQLSALVAHVALASSIAFLLDVDCPLKRAGLAVYCLPVVARMANVPVSHLHLVHNLSSALAILASIYYILSLIPGIINHIRRAYVRLIEQLETYGSIHVATETAFKFLVPAYFLTFWLVLFLAQLHAYCFTPPSPSRSMVAEEWYLILLYAVSEICCTPLSLISTCVAVCCASRGVIHLTRVFICAGGGVGVGVQEQLLHAGVGEGVTMGLLAVQTGLVQLKMPHRMGAMSVVLFIVVGSLVQSMYDITEPVLLAVSASQASTVWRHLRLLALCVFLFVFPLYMIYMLYHVFDLDFWTLVVISTCALTSVQVVGLLVVYGLFTYDALRSQPWDYLDDVVYLSRAVTRVLEFLVAVFVVGAGLRESFREEWSWMNSLVLTVHCYYNVWQRLQAGWRSFLLRREAARKIQSLPKASEEDLRRYNDVCAICYGEMRAGRVTRCKHFFHAGCLRKWLYIQDRCPMCSTNITIEDSLDEGISEGGQDDGRPGVVPEDGLEQVDHAENI